MISFKIHGWLKIECSKVGGIIVLVYSRNSWSKLLLFGDLYILNKSIEVLSNEFLFWIIVEFWKSLNFEEIFYLVKNATWYAKLIQNINDTENKTKQQKRFLKLFIWHQKMETDNGQHMKL